MTLMKSVFLVLFQFSFLILKSQTFVGKVLDFENNLPIPMVEISFVDLQTGTTTDENGLFKIENFNLKKIHIQIRFLGYDIIDELINVDEVHEKIFYLKRGLYELKEVVVSVPMGRFQVESIVSVVNKKMKDLQLTRPTTLAEAISNIPGVEQIATGVGIGKPIIRGLSGNRIVTFAHGVRIENQQWGDEHGLGVGAVGFEGVEVIKGPASLLFGPDALGGAIFFIE